MIIFDVIILIGVGIKQPLNSWWAYVIKALALGTLVLTHSLHRGFDLVFIFVLVFKVLLHFRLDPVILVTKLTLEI